MLRAGWMEMRQEISDLVYKVNACGYLLRIPHAGDSASLVESPRRVTFRKEKPEHYPQELPAIEGISIHDAEAAAMHLRIFSGRRFMDRLGWIEMGLDGDKADWYGAVC